jgi:cobalt-zinc-cadmium efflux system protein
VSGGHSHGGPEGTTAREHARPLAWTLALTGGFLIVEVAGALWTGSLALLADAGHMLTDAGGLALALFAIWFAARPPTPEKTYGYYRVEILAALVNALLLLGIAGFILYESYRRLREPAPVLAGPMLAVASAGLLVNLAGLLLLRRGAAHSLNLKGAYFEVLGDALGSLGAILAAITIMATGRTWVDPAVGMGIALFIVPRTWRLLTQAVNVLLEGTPAHLYVAEVEAAMRGVRGVVQVHDLHIWTLTSGKYAMSGHAIVDNLAVGDQLLAELHAVLHARFGIDHTTIQLESRPLVQIAVRDGGPDPPAHTAPRR